MKTLAALGALLLLPACMSTRIVFDSKWDPDSKAAYEDYFDYYLLGLVGTPSVNVQQACVDQRPYAFRRLKSGEDSLITLITLGIYSPATVRVWCGD